MSLNLTTRKAFWLRDERTNQMIAISGHADFFQTKNSKRSISNGLGIVKSGIFCIWRELEILFLGEHLYRTSTIENIYIIKSLIFADLDSFRFRSDQIRSDQARLRCFVLLVFWLGLLLFNSIHRVCLTRLIIHHYSNARIAGPTQ